MSRALNQKRVPSNKSQYQHLQSLTSGATNFRYIRSLLSFNDDLTSILPIIFTFACRRAFLDWLAGTATSDFSAAPQFHAESKEFPQIHSIQERTTSSSKGSRLFITGWAPTLLQSRIIITRTAATLGCHFYKGTSPTYLLQLSLISLPPT